MVQQPIRYKKGITIELRKKGLSYADIQNAINVPKSTIAYWLKGIKLTDFQSQKLRERQIRIARKNVKKRILKIAKKAEEIKNLSKDIGQISRRELWLMGLALYWKSAADPQKGVHFTSGNPDLIKLFLRWLREVGKIENSEIRCDILSRGKSSNIQKYWSDIVGLPIGRIYVQKMAARHGLLRIRVRASSMLARQIAGWLNGIKTILN
ncbi:MAG: hypothetical protein A2750_01175 [Candidatus Yanofskybacteria bacterium RIFCSPHIGHO2_01_FULL_45_42]|uniref:Uncharacterized protein n=3 Tax=Candidatus Yanofskyibacteriota TaxID=1752733 RepID=A0A1F8H4W1_9BACT|nr:MAG: hypothetical protein A2750_01175 [Candidatus Yanofskybacteria bacterium RIFCSPHIGHO2_01_FULL_45_42]OGN15520.1 MAG: hypothetical protein A3C81_01365 [Candidatus Yanofskybacteria bacterium RIFCSPHIGHO2_02_FULL_46_19]OGN31889.1 MAG: hypothetical protein A3J01_01910 [Candidatus Yanofskybacteria bacterium RIFCSPLOWO2_02_FULL_45_18]